MLRLYRYYLPVDAMERPAAHGMAGRAAVRRVAGCDGGAAPGPAGQHRRTWLVVSGMVPFNPLRDRDGEVVLFACLAGAGERLSVQHRPANEAVSAAGACAGGRPCGGAASRPTWCSATRCAWAATKSGKPLAPDGSIPITLYWQPAQAMDRRYKYILRLLAEDRRRRIRDARHHRTRALRWHPADDAVAAGPDDRGVCRAAAG